MSNTQEKPPRECVNGHGLFVGRVCKKCKSIRDIRYRVENKAKRTAYSREWQRRNKDKVRIRNKKAWKKWSSKPEIADYLRKRKLTAKWIEREYQLRCERRDDIRRKTAENRRRRVLTDPDLVRKQDAEKWAKYHSAEYLEYKALQRKLSAEADKSAEQDKKE